MLQTIKNIYQLGVKELISLCRDWLMLALIVYSFTFAVVTATRSQPDSINNATIAVVDEFEARLDEYNPANVFSATIPNSLRTGRDAFADGCDRNFSDLLTTGFGSAIDALSVVEELVYDRREITLEELAAALNEADLLVQATSLGLRPEDQPPIDLDLLDAAKDLAVIDLVYLPTPLLEKAAEKGLKHCDGSEMLLRQGAASFRFWTGVEPPLEAMRRGMKEDRTDTPPFDWRCAPANDE